MTGSVWTDAAAPKRLPTPLETLAVIYRRAAHALETQSFVDDECCGMPVDELGRCELRPGHATQASPNPLDYPGHYDEEGQLR